MDFLWYSYIALRNCLQELRGDTYARACDIEDYFAGRVLRFGRSPVGFVAFLAVRRARFALYRVLYGPKYLWCAECESVARYSWPTPYCDKCGGQG